MAIPVGAFFEHGAWSTARLLDVCEPLPDEQLDATGDGAFGSIRATLTHLVATEQRYLRRMGLPEHPDPVEEGAFPGFETLRRAAAGNGRALAAMAEQATPELVLPGSAELGFERATATVLLVQVLNHSTEHRTQIVSTLSLLGAGPDGLDEAIDGWTWGISQGTLTPR
jgi:uncharacterized damage-inducible protein DinB